MSQNVFLDTAYIDTESIISSDEIAKINRKYFGIDINGINDDINEINEINQINKTNQINKANSANNADSANNVSSTKQYLGWITNYFKKPAELKFATSSESPDPFGLLFTALICIFMYVYFANEFFCQIFGLYYPIYYLYVLLNLNQTPQQIFKIKCVIKYFVLYGHLELISSLLKIFGLYFYHLKILVIFTLLYAIRRNQSLLDHMYVKIISYDRVAINIILSLISKCKKEFNKYKSGNVTKI